MTARPDHRPIVWRGSAESDGSSEASDVTRILAATEQGDLDAADKLLPLVYEELRKVAAHRMANEAAGQTLQPTALVHEAWMRLVGKENPKFENRAHFFAADINPVNRPRAAVAGVRCRPH